MSDLTTSAKKKSVKRFYRDQGETLNSFEECERLIQAGAADEEDDSRSLKESCAVNLSLAVCVVHRTAYLFGFFFFNSLASSRLFCSGSDAKSPPRPSSSSFRTCCYRILTVTTSLCTPPTTHRNVALLVFKIIALVQSGSISVFSAVIDSALDIFNGIVIFFVSRYMKKRDRYLYPMGKGRFDALATIVIASVMVTFAFEIVRRAVDEIIELQNNVTAVDGEVGLDTLSIALMSSTVGLKLGLFLFCRAIGGSMAMVSALANDHINDCLTNTVALIGGGLASKYPNADPVGAIVIGIYIMYSWYVEGKENIKNLAGQTASPAMIKQLTYIAMHHDRRVNMVDTVRAIHLGSNVLVEVDIVLPPEMPLHEAHDIGESLQHRLELLSDVDRAHVHLDYEIDHGPEDEHKRL